MAIKMYNSIKMPIEIKHGDLLKSDAQYICHQCNCVTRRGANLSADVFAHFPYANIYAERDNNYQPSIDMLGNIIIRGNGIEQRFVINLLAQYYPGRPRFPQSNRDGYEVRERAFLRCMKKIASIPNIESLAFPWMIGCGAAGGDWEHYLSIIELLSKKISSNVYILKLKD